MGPMVSDLVAEQVALADIMADHEFVLYDNLVIIKGYENNTENN